MAKTPLDAEHGTAPHGLLSLVGHFGPQERNFCPCQAGELLQCLGQKPGNALPVNGAFAGLLVSS